IQVAPRTSGRYGQLRRFAGYQAVNVGWRGGSLVLTSSGASSTVARVTTAQDDAQGTPVHADVAICGARPAALALAVDAVERGFSAVVVEQDERANGASMRTFGHLFVTGQAGVALEAAEEARTRWLRLAREAGFWLEQGGSVVVTRAADEL